MLKPGTAQFGTSKPCHYMNIIISLTLT